MYPVLPLYCCYWGLKKIERERESKMERKILIAVDESEESKHALGWAIEHLKIGLGSSTDVLILLNVQTPSQFLVPPVGPGLYITPEIIESVRKHQDDVSKKVLLRAKQICDEKNITTETMVSQGDPRDAICEAVEKLQVSYLVVGSHGYGAFKRAFLGSVSDYCAHNAKCPVVIVKKP